MHQLSTPSRAPRLAYGYYVVLVLMLAYTLSFADRVLISLLLEPIRAEFRLNDTQLGMLIGFGFVLFYSAMGIPFGSLADRTNRRNLIALGIAGWSLATMGTGLAQGFGSLLFMRALVGVGEASLSPAALSTIADRFPRRRLAFALAIYSSGVVIGGGAAMAFGGLMAQWSLATSLYIPGIGDLTGWRLTFALVGLAGLPLIILILLTVREAGRSEKIQVPSTQAVLALFRDRRRAFAGAIIGLGLVVLGNYVPMLWAPAFLARQHHMPIADIGLVLGAINGVLGLSGVLIGGMLADKLIAQGIADAPIPVIIATQLLQLPFVFATFLVANTTVALTCIAIASFFGAMIGGLQGTTISLLAPPQMRGRIMAIYLFVANFVGMGVGPLSVGLLSDWLGGAVGAAIATVAGTGIVLGVITLVRTRPAIKQAIHFQNLTREGAALDR